MKLVTRKIRNDIMADAWPVVRYKIGRRYNKKIHERISYSRHALWCHYIRDEIHILINGVK